MVHKGIPKLVAPVLFTTILYTVQLCTCTKAYPQSGLYYSHSSGKMCLLFQHNSHQNREPILCLKLCWHNLPGPTNMAHIGCDTLFTVGACYMHDSIDTLGLIEHKAFQIIYPMLPINCLLT